MLIVIFKVMTRMTDKHILTEMSGLSRFYQTFHNFHSFFFLPFSKVWFKNRRAKFRQQNKQQQGVQNKPKPPVKRKTPSPPLQQVQDLPKASGQAPPASQQMNNFTFGAPSWPNKHNIQGLPNMQRHDNYQKYINSSMNAFSGANFPAAQPHFNPNHEQYFPYMTNGGPMPGDLTRNRLESSPLMC